MRDIRRKLLIVIGICFISGPLAFGKNVATTGDGFLNLGVGARALSMGGAFTALANDVSASYWNPAGLAQLPSSQFISMYDAPFEDISHIYLAFCYKHKENSRNVFGLHINYLSSGDILKTDGLGNDNGNFNTSDMAVGFSYARAMSDNLYLGANLKSVSKSIAELSGSGVAADFGGLYKQSDNFNIGFSLQNMGTGLQLYREVTPFPSIFRAGISYFTIIQSVYPLYLTSDFIYLATDGNTGMSLGVEYLYRFLNLRLGAEKLGERMSPAFGIGIDHKNISVDLGLSTNEALGSAFKISLLVRL